MSLIDSPTSIYANLSREIYRILNTLESPSNEGNVLELQLSIRNLLGGFQKELDQRIDELKANAEWDTFTIAFYGETNAGKSTIIETLRILFEERTKLKDRQIFRALQAEHGLTRESLDSARQAIIESEQLVTDLQIQLTERLPQLDQCAMALKDNLERLRNLIVVRKRTASLWQKLLHLLSWLFLFRRLPEELAYIKAARQLEIFEADRVQVTANLKSQQHDADAQSVAAVETLKCLESGLRKLKTHADGGIIGNGSSDFTLATQMYYFESGQQKFALLDVPGIEGDEEKVTREIWNAVQKAHAVFYVTSKAAAPQKGDDGTMGTLEKIRRHLGSQTEVWTLYNKRVTNPIQLEAKGLLSEDELASLQVLDEKMREQLGDHYLRSLPLSAQPAFLSVAKCLVPESLSAKSQDKFLRKLSSDELLAQSNLLYLQALLAGDFVRNYKEKIVHSNANKANQLVRGAAEQLTRLQQERLIPLKESLRKDTDDACSQLELCLTALQGQLDARAETAINLLTTKVRKRLYVQIDADISNDNFKQAFKSALEDAQKEVQRDLPEQIRRELERFGADVSDVVKRFQQFAQELMDSFGGIGMDGLHGKIDVKINIDNGIKMQNLLAALVGGVLMLWNPGGWLVVAAGVAALLLSIGKALYGFFSSDYRKAQQRKAVDENLREIANSMRGSIRADLKKAFPVVKGKIQEIQASIAEPVRQIMGINSVVLRAISELSRLSNSIAKTGTR